MDIENILKKSEELIKNNEELNSIDEFKTRYVLTDKKDVKNPIVVAYNDFDIYELYISNGNFVQLADWNYSVDDDILGHLEQSKEIGYMDIETHYNIWSYVDDMYDNIEHIDGLNKYIEYCINNNITKEIIDEKIRLDVPDVVKYYKKNQEIER